MSFSGRPGEAYPVRKLLTISIGILRAVEMKAKKQQSELNSSLEKIESIAKEVVDEKAYTATTSDSKDQGTIKYEDVVKQINAIERNWLKGETL